jgi:virginiamycin A acetyltransferase
VLHHYPFIGDRLVIGKFCAIAEGARFIMNGANHAMSGFSTYPFNIFGHGWEEGFDVRTWEAENRGDTVVGNDVWIGMEAVILPGIRIGDGAIVAAKSVVTHDVPAYAIVAGNAAKVVKMRFDDKTVKRLLKVAWWDWPQDKVSRNLDAIRGADIEALEAAS